MQRGGRRDDARKKAMERLDWLLEWITARQGVAVTFYGERPGNLVYRARKRCFHCRVPCSQVEGMPCSPMTWTTEVDRRLHPVMARAVLLSQTKSF